ncbi:MAG: M56 family metallopeptidase [Gemmatimonadota bacterium]
MSTLPIDLLSKAIILLIATWVLSLALRSRSASLRSLIWTLALGGVLALPVLTTVTPPLRMGILPSREAPKNLAPLEKAPALVENAMPSLRVNQSSGVPLPPAGQGTTALRQPIAPDSPSIPWSRVGMALWVFGLGVLLVRMVASTNALRRLVRSSRPADESWGRLVERTRHELGIMRPVRSLVCDAIAVPAIAGTIRPVLLLPAESEDWPEADRRQVALHEIAHVARWDGMSQLICQLACALYWPVPLVWMAARRAAQLRELACDNVVLNAGTRASTYAENLLRIVSLAGSAELPPGALAMGYPSGLDHRVRGILDPAARRDSVSGRTTILMMALAAGVFGLVAAAQPAVRSDAPLVLRTTAARPNAKEARAPVSVIPSDTVIFCSQGVNSSSSSINEDDDHNRSWTVKVTGTDCKVDLRMEGKVEFNDDFTDVTSISNGGFFRLDATDHGVRHQLELSPRNGTLERTWRVNGSEQTYDAEARRWFATFLLELDRRTAIAVDIRLPLLIKQGGVTAVLNETAKMPSDYARSQYYTKLAASDHLSPVEVKRIFEQAVTLKTSDYYSSELIKAFLGNGVEDPAMREVVLSMVDQMDSDYYRHEAMNTLLASGRPTAAEMNVLLTVVGRMESSYYQAETLKQLLMLGTITPAQRAMVTRTVASMKDDYQMAEVLKVLITKGDMTEDERTAFFTALSSVDSDYYMYEIAHAMLAEHQPSSSESSLVLRSAGRMKSDYYRGELASDLLESKGLTASDLVSVVDLVRSMESDYTKGEVLQKVLQHDAANDQVRKAVLDAANSLGEYYRNEVRRSAGQG